MSLQNRVKRLEEQQAESDEILLFLGTDEDGWTQHNGKDAGRTFTTEELRERRRQSPTKVIRVRAPDEI